MRRWRGRTAVVLAMLTIPIGIAAAQMAPGGGPMGMGPGMMGPWPGMMGPGMMCPCPGMMGMGPGMGWGMGPGMMGPGMGWGMGHGMMAMGPSMAAPTITEERARELAQQYTDNYFKGFKVERALPITWGNMTMYQAELKGPQGETHLLHINPWGNVMPSGGPMTMMR